MPLKKGASRETISENIAEFHDSARYAATKRKSGKQAADKQAVAAALNMARESGAKIPPKKDAGKTPGKTAAKTVRKPASKAAKKTPRKAVKKSRS